MSANAYLEVDTLAIKHNTDLFRTLIDPDTKIISIIKANGYGLDMVQLAHLQEQHEIDLFGVLDVEQGKALRQSGIQTPILLIGAVLEDQFQDLIDYDLIQVAVSLEAAQRMSEYALKQDTKIQVHVKYDSGLHRLGMTSYEDIKACYALEGLDVQGIYSHFIESQNETDEGRAVTQHQIDLFNIVLDQLKEDGIEAGMTHIQNSPSILSFGNLGYHAVRCGMIMFGLFHPSQRHHAADLGFLPVLKLKAHIALVRDVKAGDSIGYSRSYKVSKDMRIATVSAGYCDGIMKHLSLNGGGVVINDVLCPILGDIAMSHFMIDVSHVEVKPEDVVVVVGHPLQDLYTSIELSQQSINEFVSHLSQSLVRVYK